MQIEQTFALLSAPADSWPAFKDIGLLVECLPGASLTGPEHDGLVPLHFDVKLGPIAAAFSGLATVTFDDARRAGRFEGTAADKRTNSRIKGAADFELQASATGTLVAVRVDYVLSGSLAQFGRAGIVKELAGALTAQFAENLRVRLGTTPSRATTEVVTLSGAETPAAPARAAELRPLDGASLLLRAWRALLGRWLRRLTGQRS
jgi:carbon monoxide dehydrogenase subunit G